MTMQQCKVCCGAVDPEDGACTTCGHLQLDSDGVLAGDLSDEDLDSAFSWAANMAITTGIPTREERQRRMRCLERHED